MAAGVINRRKERFEVYNNVRYLNDFGKAISRISVFPSTMTSRDTEV